MRFLEITCIITSIPKPKSPISSFVIDWLYLLCFMLRILVVLSLLSPPPPPPSMPAQKRSFPDSPHDHHRHANQSNHEHEEDDYDKSDGSFSPLPFHSFSIHLHLLLNFSCSFFRVLRFWPCPISRRKIRVLFSSLPHSLYIGCYAKCLLISDTRC